LSEVKRSYLIKGTNQLSFTVSGSTLAVSLGVCGKPLACLTQTPLPEDSRPYRIEGKTRLLSRLTYLKDNNSAIGARLVQAGLDR
jgi:hypothetical protein